MQVDILIVPRACNSVAHEIACVSLGSNFDQFTIWTDPFPEFVNILVGRDYIDPMVNE